MNNEENKGFTWCGFRVKPLGENKDYERGYNQAKKEFLNRFNGFLDNDCDSYTREEVEKLKEIIGKQENKEITEELKKQIKEDKNETK